MIKFQRLKIYELLKDVDVRREIREAFGEYVREKINCCDLDWIVEEAKILDALAELEDDGNAHKWDEVDDEEDEQ